MKMPHLHFMSLVFTSYEERRNLTHAYMKNGGEQQKAKAGTTMLAREQS